MLRPGTQGNITVYLGISLVLIILMPFLYLADASAYAQCSDLGICEFLDIIGTNESFNSGESAEKARWEVPPPFSILDLIHPSLIHPRTPNYELKKHHQQQAYHLVPRYKDDFTGDNIIPSPSFILLWFWKLAPLIAKPGLLKTGEPLFLPFNQTILNTSVIIS